MWTFLKYALVVGLAALITLPLLKMGIDWVAGKASFLKPVAAYADKA